MRDHGGNIDAARAEFGGAPEAWIDLSTGINRAPYPDLACPPEAWQALPMQADLTRLHTIAARAYGTNAAILATSGATAPIQMIPQTLPTGRAAILGPTYNEHAASARAQGWDVAEVSRVADLKGADLAILVNPNNPDGRTHDPAALLDLAGSVGTLVVDESFADVAPRLSLAPAPRRPDNLIVLRSFGKFFGLAGLRLGFVLGADDRIARLRDMAGPWPVSGPAIQIGARALADTSWISDTRSRLAREALKLDAMAAQRGWRLEGGTDLFRLYQTPDAASAQRALATHRIWSRIFPWSSRLIRLGLPAGAQEWARVAEAFARI